MQFTSGRIEISVHRRLQVPREKCERATHASQSEFYRIPSNDCRECVATALIFCSFSRLHSSLLRSDRTFVHAWICTDDMQASQLQVKGPALPPL